MFVNHRFSLNQAAVQSLYRQSYEFGFQGFGEITNYRTYSRIKDDGTQEHWPDTILRCVEGVMSIRKDWYLKHGLPWDEQYWQEFATKMSEYFISMKCLPPGRGLRNMGTDYVYERGSMSLNNCALSDTLNFSQDCGWIADALMCGAGVGFLVHQNYRQFNAPKNNTYRFNVPDSREGWVESIERLIKSYEDGSESVFFDYSEIRPAGTPLKGMGGVACGSGPLELLHDRIRLTLEKYIAGDIGSSRMMADVINAIGVCVISGGIRRSAQICIGKPDDEEFLNLKNYEQYPRHSDSNCTDPNCRCDIGWTSNNSAVLSKSSDFLHIPKLTQLNRRRGEPGLLNLVNIQNYGKYKKEWKDHAIGVNPCVTGETLVAVADGRNAVAIKDLKKDTLVFCLNNENELVVRMLRNPRITGFKRKILKIGLDNGEYLRVTENHKFLTPKNGYIPANELKIDDRLSVLTKYIPEKCIGESRADKYTSLSWRGFSAYTEHSIIGEFLYGDLNGKHIHHKDGDKLNNSLENLAIKASEKHLSDHSIGENNPRYSGLTNKELIEAGVKLCQKLNRRFSSKEWQKFGPIKSFSKFRENLGSYKEFSILCATKAGVISKDIDPRTLKTYHDMLEAGYNAKIINKTVFIIKDCEACGKEFTIKHSRREQASCGFSCANKLRDYTKASHSIRATIKKKQEKIRHQQIEIFLKFIETYNREPLKKEWQELCKKHGISAEVGRKTSPFTSWKILKEAAKAYNHKITYIIEDGYEDVWNGTVDEFHNFFIGGFEEGFTEKGRKKIVWVNNTQCGEIALENKELCCLSEVIPTRCDNYDEFQRALQYATFYASTVSLLPTHRPETNKVISRNHRIGVSLTGVADWFAQSDHTTVTRWMKDGYKFIRHYNKQLAAEAGVRISVRVSTIKPSGTLSKLVGVSPGIHPPSFTHAIRRIRVAKLAPISKILIKAGYPFETDHYNDNQYCFEVPIYQGTARPASQVSAWEQFSRVATAQREWSDNAVSATILYDEETEGHQLEHMLAQFTPMLKSISVLPHNKDCYIQPPEQELSKEEFEHRISLIKPIDWSNFGNSDGDDEADKYCGSNGCEIQLDKA